MRPRTDAQQQRQERRSYTSGRYDRGPICEVCGKAAGFDYQSIGPHSDGGLVICARRACVRKVDALTPAQLELLRQTHPNRVYIWDVIPSAPRPDWATAAPSPSLNPGTCTI